MTRDEAVDLVAELVQAVVDYENAAGRDSPRMLQEIRNAKEKIISALTKDDGRLDALKAVVQAWDAYPGLEPDDEIVTKVHAAIALTEG